MFLIASAPVQDFSLDAMSYKNMEMSRKLTHRFTFYTTILRTMLQVKVKYVDEWVGREESFKTFDDRQPNPLNSQVYRNKVAPWMLLSPVIT